MNALDRLLSMLPFLLLCAGCSIGVRDSYPPVCSCNADKEKYTNESDKGNQSQAESKRNRAQEELRAKLAAQSRQTNKLQLQLLVKQAELNKLQLSHDRVKQKAMRANTRLRTLHSKADTIADIAEASLLIKNAREVSADEQLPALDRAEQLLEESQHELRAGNLDDASDLAAKALDLALTKSQFAKSAQPAHQKPAETMFAAPLAMKVSKQSNIREKPTADSKPLFQLAKGTPVKAQGYRGLWVKVAAEDQGEGWIFYQLLEAADMTE